MLSGFLNIYCSSTLFMNLYSQQVNCVLCTAWDGLTSSQGFSRSASSEGRLLLVLETQLAPNVQVRVRMGTHWQCTEIKKKKKISLDLLILEFSFQNNQGHHFIHHIKVYHCTVYLKLILKKSQSLFKKKQDLWIINDYKQLLGSYVLKMFIYQSPLTQLCILNECYFI